MYDRFLIFEIYVQIMFPKNDQVWENKVTKEDY